MVSPALGVRCKRFGPVGNGIPSILLRVRCLPVRHMPELAILTRFGPNKCSNEELGRGNLRLRKDRLHFWVMFWNSLSRSVLGFEMSHARSVSRTHRASNPRHFSPFSLNVQLWRASLIVRARAWSAGGRRGRMCCGPAAGSSPSGLQPISR